MLTYLHKLRFFYLLAIATVVLMLALNQWVAQRLLHKQEADGQVVNVAGRQRMLSQRLSKLALLYAQDTPEPEATAWQKEFFGSLELFTTSHKRLLSGQVAQGEYAPLSDTIRQMYADLDVYYLPLTNALNLFAEKTKTHQDVTEERKQILRYEQLFLTNMDAIVFQHANESKAKIFQLQRWENWLLAVALIALAIELLFIFRPMLIKLEQTLQENAVYQEELKGIAASNALAKEKAEADSKAKSAFLSNMSHEIRTPMNGVMGMAELMAYTPLDKTQQDYLHIIRTSADNLLRIINDILDFSKIEAGGIQLDLHSYSLRTLVEEALDLLSVKAAEKNIDLLYHLDERVPERLRFDSTRLRQVLLNLVGNAVKFTHKGHVDVRVYFLSETDTHVELNFQVIDSGIGIPTDKQDMLFTAFTQAEVHIARDYGGTGLGLAISSHMVRVMGGELRVESQVGHGSNFFFILPFEKETRLLENNPVETDHLAGKTALLVDDNAANRSLMEELCRRWGMQTMSASDGQQALTLANSLAVGPDFALLDMNMPGMDGLALRTALGHLPAWKDTQYVLLSSSAFSERKGSSGFDASLTKPVKHLVLHNELEALTQGNTRKLTDQTVMLPEPEQQPRLKLLLAEDNVVNQQFIHRALSKLGHEVDLVDNGQKALEYALRTPYDLVLMDVHMPVLDGMEASRRILAQKPDTIILAVTANATTEVKEACLKAGMKDFLSKPFSVEQLGCLLSKWVSNKD
ncbi:MAG: response regulator [Saprospiraceae bacterium]